jgi:septal ring factor EnvC (AmiA/AmiB activator)
MIRWRDLSLVGRIAAALTLLAALLLAVALAARWWDGLTAWLPWSDESRLDRAEVRLDRLQTDLAERQARVQALERQAAATHAAHDTITQARTITARATAHAETAPDAETEIDPDRADRLRDADRRLCALQPDLCSDDRPAGDGA